MGKFDKEIMKMEELTYKVLDHEKRLLDLEVAIDESKEGFGILNEKGIFIFVNEAYAAMFEMSPEELIGKSWEAKYKDPKAVEYIKNEIFPLIIKNGTWSGIVKARACTGEMMTQILTLTTTGSNISCHTRQVGLFNIQ